MTASFNLTNDVPKFNAEVSKLSELQKSHSGFFHSITRLFDSQLAEQENQEEVVQFKTCQDLARNILANQKNELITDKNFDMGMNILFKQIMPKLKINPYKKIEKKETKNSASKVNDISANKHISTTQSPTHLAKDHKMPKEIQHYFNKELETLDLEKTKSKRSASPAAADSVDLKLLRKKEKMKLAETLGVKQKATKGASGTLISEDIHGKRIIVLKSDTPSFVTSIKNWFKAHAVDQLSYLSNAPSAQLKSERAAYRLNELLGLNFVPISTYDKNKEISTQLFVTKVKKDSKGKKLEEPLKFQETKDAKKQFDSKFVTISEKDREESWVYEGEPTILPRVFTENEKTLFQKFAIFDFLIGNLDRHDENWFVTLDDQNHITNIAAIDNANAFPKEHPKKDSFAARKQYKWKELSIANEKFTPESVRFVKKYLSPEKIQDYIIEINRDTDGLLDTKMQELFIKRANFLYIYVSKGYSPKDLGECSDDTSMTDALTKIPGSDT